jgi:hypothetical protein
MPYRNWADTDTLNAADLNAMTADAVPANVDTEESTTSTSYTNLTTTANQFVTLTLVSGQGCLVIVSAAMINQTGGGGAYESFEVTGASGTQVASDTNAAWSNNVERVTVSKLSWYTAATTGSHTFTLKFKKGAGGATAFFANRRIIVKKF